MNIIKKILRKAYRITIRPRVAMPRGKELNVDTESLRRINPQYGDWIIHPCVRYIPEGFAGHRWWMVVTPYPQYKCELENPVLYYGQGNTEEPPTEWTFVRIIQDTHPKGYNADGNLYFDGKKLWIFWKESDTQNTRPECGYKNMMGVSYDGINFSKPRVFCNNPDDKSMYLAAPVVMNIQQGKSKDIKCIGVFSPVINDNAKGKEFMHPRSLAVFGLNNNDLENGQFHFERIAKQTYFEGCDFWHVDMFEYNGKYYCLETPQNGAFILLGESTDGMSYRFFKMPLQHQNSYHPTPYLYKASGVVIGGFFHLFYPTKMKDKKRVHLFCSTIKMDELLKKLEG